MAVVTMENDNKIHPVSDRRIGFGIILSIVFITLKLFGVINWSWVWVLSPLWIPITMIIALIVVLVIGNRESSYYGS